MPVPMVRPSNGRVCLNSAEIARSSWQCSRTQSMRVDTTWSVTPSPAASRPGSRETGSRETGLQVRLGHPGYSEWLLRQLTFGDQGALLGDDTRELHPRADAELPEDVAQVKRRRCAG